MRPIGLVSIQADGEEPLFVHDGTVDVVVGDGRARGTAESPTVLRGNAEFDVPLEIFCIGPHDELPEGYDPELRSSFCRQFRSLF